ncbi:hypothetical protein [Dactylosporangium sp. CS-033363]|uniref:hypothetical protein n=1 Tax=Dactylosporangium sp. CS-033363 TaxID=3239935 RepID=UPI003D8F6FB8
MSVTIASLRVGDWVVPAPLLVALLIALAYAGLIAAHARLIRRDRRPGAYEPRAALWLASRFGPLPEPLSEPRAGLARPESRDGSRDGLARPGSRDGSRDGLARPGSRDGFARPESRDGSRDGSARPESRDGSRDGSARPESRDGSRDGLARPEAPDSLAQVEAEAIERLLSGRLEPAEYRAVMADVAARSSAR